MLFFSKLIPNAYSFDTAFSLDLQKKIHAVFISGFSLGDFGCRNSVDNSLF
jgi:hypothetical protein